MEQSKKSWEKPAFKLYLAGSAEYDRLKELLNEEEPRGVTEKKAVSQD